MQTFPNLAQCNGSSFFLLVLIFSGHFSQCRSSVEAWRFFYIAPTSKSPTAQAHQQQLGDHCEPTLTTHYITSLATWPTQYITLHYITLHCISFQPTTHDNALLYITTQQSTHYMASLAPLLVFNPGDH